jgi:hypothetical protein
MARKIQGGVKMMKNVIFVGLAFGMVACVDETPKSAIETESTLPLTSRAELDAYLRHEPVTSPMKLLSTSSRQRFVDGLVFGEHGGVASFFFGDMQVELSDADARAVLRLFDTEASWDWIAPPQNVVKPEPPTGWKDYYCQSRGTCAYQLRYICTSNC